MISIFILINTIKEQTNPFIGFSHSRWASKPHNSSEGAKMSFALMIKWNVCSTKKIGTLANESKNIWYMGPCHTQRLDTYILCYQLGHTHLICNATLQYSLQIFISGIVTVNRPFCSRKYKSYKSLTVNH